MNVTINFFFKANLIILRDDTLLFLCLSMLKLKVYIMFWLIYRSIVVHRHSTIVEYSMYNGSNCALGHKDNTKYYHCNRLKSGVSQGLILDLATLVLKWATIVYFLLCHEVGESSSLEEKPMVEWWSIGSPNQSILAKAQSWRDDCEEDWQPQYRVPLR